MLPKQAAQAGTAAGSTASGLNFTAADLGPRRLLEEVSQAG